MAEDWKSWSFRQKVITQLEEIIRQSPAANQRNAHDIELQVHAFSTFDFIHVLTKWHNKGGIQNCLLV